MTVKRTPSTRSGPLAAVFATAMLALAPAQALASACHSFVQSVPDLRVAVLDLTPAAAAGSSTTTAQTILSDVSAQDVLASVGEMEITFVGHSTYRITSPGGVVVATDYNGRHGQGRLPDVVTMNNAHSTHYTDFPDPGITHVLRGWTSGGPGPAAHLLELGDMVVRNVPTDIRSGFAGRRPDGNSIFVFEIGEICIAHLGHIHHTLSDTHYNQLGRIDVLMAPVDGTYTLSLADMIGIAKRLKSRIVLPMHSFGSASLRLFIDGMRDEFAVQVRDERTMRLAQGGLPDVPTVMILGSSRLRGWED
ncbi:MAG: MBL fold metallo-hydrolase [Pseudomonadota bacterium]